MTDVRNSWDSGYDGEQNKTLHSIQMEEKFRLKNTKWAPARKDDPARRRDDEEKDKEKETKRWVPTLDRGATDGASRAGVQPAGAREEPEEKRADREPRSPAKPDEKDHGDKFKTPTPTASAGPK